VLSGRRGQCAQKKSVDFVKRNVEPLKDDTVDDPDLIPPPDEVAAEVVENLEAALAVSDFGPFRVRCPS
jgi:hypothetical protein